MPFLLNEDAALKAQLSGITVTDANAPTGRPVAVRFRLPETELADMTFPSIIINHEGISLDPEREHRGYGQLPYIPEGLGTPNNWPDVNADPAVVEYDPTESPYWTEFPVPVNIDYTVMAYSRKAQHNVALVGALAQWNRIPPRFGFLGITQDGTVRRLDVLGGPRIEAAKDEQGKRVFRIIYAIRVSSELLQSEIETKTKVLNTSLSLLYQSEPYAA